MLNMLLIANLTVVSVTLILLMVTLLVQLKQHKGQKKINSKLKKDRLAIKSLHTAIKHLDKKLENACNVAQTDKQWAPPAALRNGIEYQYERAKRLLKKNPNEEGFSLANCRMTEEEMELLNDVSFKD